MQGSFVTVLSAEPAAPAAGFAPRSVVEVHGGRELDSGDDLLAAFASAVSAVSCAVELQRAGPPLNIGLAAGEPATGADQRFGNVGVLAQRLGQSAEPGQILATDLVRQVAAPRLEDALFQPLGPRRLRGVTDRVTVFAVGWDQAPTAVEDSAPDPDVSVVIADDQQLLRAGFRVILEDEPGIRVVGEAGDGRTAVDVVLRRRPDVVLMDIRMPELDGLRAAERIIAEPGLETAVLMLTTFDVREYVYEALRIGASGFLLKDTPSDRLVDAVRVVAAGDALLAPSVTRQLIGEFARGPRRAEGDPPPPELAELTAREVDVLRLVGRGLSNAEIATELVLGENTVKTHVANLRGKLGLRDRVQAVVLAFETGLVEAG